MTIANISNMVETPSAPSWRTRMVEPDVIMLNAAIGACERATEWQEALQLLDGSQVFPDIVTYNTLMSALILVGAGGLKESLAAGLL